MAAKWAELGSGGSPGTMAEKKAALVAGGLAVLSKGAALAKAGGGASIGAFKVTRPCRTPPPPPPPLPRHARPGARKAPAAAPGLSRRHPPSQRGPSRGQGRIGRSAAAGCRISRAC